MTVRISVEAAKTEGLQSESGAVVVDYVRARKELSGSAPTTTAGGTSHVRQPEVGQSPRYVWYVIGLLFVVNVVNYMDRMALAVLMPSIQSDLHLSDGQLGFLVGFAFSVFYAICGVPIARWADRGVRRNIIALALTTWSLLTAAGGAAQNFWHLFAVRVGVGAGEAGCLPPGQSILCDYVPLARRAGVFAINDFGLYAGMMVGMGLAGWLGDAVGWRWTFVMLGLPGVLLAIVVRLTLREPRRGFFDLPEEEHVPRLSLRATFSILWRCRTYRLLMIFLTLNGFVQYGLTQWLPSFYARVYGLSLSSTGVQLGIAIGVGAGGGLLIGGVAANRSAGRNIRRPLQLGALAICFAVPAAFALLFVSSVPSSMAMVALTALLWNVSSGPVVSTVYSVVAPRMRATAGAITIFCTSVLGFGLGPFIVGTVSDMLLPWLATEALRYALVIPIVLMPAMAIVLRMASKTLPHDLKVATGGG